MATSSLIIGIFSFVIAQSADSDCVWENNDGAVFNLTSIAHQLTVGWVAAAQTRYFLLTPCANGIICDEKTQTFYMGIETSTFPNNDCLAYLAKEEASDKPVSFTKKNGGTIKFQYTGQWIDSHPGCTAGINTTLVYQCNSKNGEQLTPMTIESDDPCAVTMIENTSLACVY